MNNAQLLRYHNEIMRMQGSVLEVFLDSKIKEFYKNNIIRINTLTEKLNALSGEYLKMEGGKAIYDENKNPISLEGKSLDEYHQKVKELMSQEINIVL